MCRAFEVLFGVVNKAVLVLLHCIGYTFLKLIIVSSIFLIKNVANVMANTFMREKNDNRYKHHSTTYMYLRVTVQ